MGRAALEKGFAYPVHMPCLSEAVKVPASLFIVAPIHLNWQDLIYVISPQYSLSHLHIPPDDSSSWAKIRPGL